MRTVLLSGGVGGAKLAAGLAAVLPPEDLTVIGNTGDDLEVYGLRVSPDLDILAYTLAGAADPERGWGLRGDTFRVLEALEGLGEETWFRLGDADMATCLVRTRMLRAGRRLTEAAAEIGDLLGLSVRILPASDDDVRTWIRTPHGWIGFQDFFVRERCGLEILEVAYRGAEAARATPEALAAISAAEAILVAPSNPIASIGPILAVPGIREALRAARAPKVGVSPIVAGASLKGPSDRMLRAAGFVASAAGVARFYAGLLDSLVIDRADAALEAEVSAAGLRAHVVPTVVRTHEEKAALALEILALAASIVGAGKRR